jgi:hypothetical protein
MKIRAITHIICISGVIRATHGTVFPLHFFLGHQEDLVPKE